MGTDTVTAPPSRDPHLPTIPFSPQTNHPTTADVAMMIDSRIHGTLDSLRMEYNQNQGRQNVYKAVGVGIGGLAVGVASTMLVGRLVRSRRARNAASGTGR